MIKHKDQRVGVFIDTQNMYYSARYLFQRKVNFKNIVDDAVAGRQLIRALAYVVSTKDASEKPFFEALQKSGIETREKELMEYASGHKKADWDVGLAIDAVQMLDVLDVVVIVSGDGDFIPLVEHIQSRGRIAEVMAFGETTSSTLLTFVDDFTDLSQNKRRYLIGPVVHPSGHAKTASDKGGQDDTGENEQGEGGFIMEAPTGDQEESRTRRLEF
ncbi:NYN domain-containing protein [Candidatus Parcubacteria bacterium]|nr:NYN domain-containing protein [Candidatus Parcubacteria bacterium]